MQRHLHLLFAIALVACSDPTDTPLQIDVRTDYTPLEDFDAVRVQVGQP